MALKSLRPQPRPALTNLNNGYSLDFNRVETSSQVDKDIVEPESSFLWGCSRLKARDMAFFQEAWKQFLLRGLKFRVRNQEVTLFLVSSV